MRRRLIDIFILLLGVTIGFSFCYFFGNHNKNIETKVIEKNNVIVNDSDISDGIKLVKDSVVSIEQYSYGRVASIGTGFVYNKDDKYGYILTNQHVVGSQKKVNVIFNNEKSVEVEVIGFSEYADIAVLKVPINYIISVANIGTTKNIEPGDTVFAIGTPIEKMYSGSVTKGIVSGLNRLVGVDVNSTRPSDGIMNVIQTDAAINSGNSGGPLCDANGNVIGVNTMKIVQNYVEGMGFAIPIEDALYYANSIVNNIEIERPKINANISSLNGYSSSVNGVLVNSKTVEFEKGDIITKIDKYSINNYAEYRYYLYKFSPGDTINVTVDRNGEEKELTIKLIKE